MTIRTYSITDKRRSSVDCHKGRVFAALALGLLFLASTLTITGCGASAGVNKYTKTANEIIAPINAQKEELKRCWALQLSDQTDINEKLAAFRKSLADATNVLDSTDAPDSCRGLDDTLGKVVDEGRALTDLNTGLADYINSLAPMAKTASEIVASLQTLKDSQDVPTTVTTLLQKSQGLEGSTRTLNPGSTYEDINRSFSEYCASMTRNLADAQAKLRNQEPSTERYEPGTRSEEEQAKIDERDKAEREAQVKSVERYTEACVEDWGRVNGQITAMLDQIRESVGIKAKSGVVETYIGQAVQQIQELQKQYK